MAADDRVLDPAEGLDKLVDVEHWTSLNEVDLSYIVASNVDELLRPLFVRFEQLQGRVVAMQDSLERLPQEAELQQRLAAVEAVLLETEQRRRELLDEFNGKVDAHNDALKGRVLTAVNHVAREAAGSLGEAQEALDRRVADVGRALATLRDEGKQSAGGWGAQFSLSRLVGRGGGGGDGDGDEPAEGASPASALLDRSVPASWRSSAMPMPSRESLAGMDSQFSPPFAASMGSHARRSSSREMGDERDEDSAADVPPLNPALPRAEGLMGGELPPVGVGAPGVGGGSRAWARYSTMRSGQGMGVPASTSGVGRDRFGVGDEDDDRAASFRWGGLRSSHAQFGAEGMPRGEHA